MMNVNWHDANASDRFFVALQHQLVAGVRSIGVDSRLMRVFALPALALPTGISFLALGVAKSIAHVAEAVFKGIANLVAWPFSNGFTYHHAFVLIGGETLAGVADLAPTLLKSIALVGIVVLTGFFD